ncbi:MAG TPA: PAS domain S-box protein [Solirubrobacteraceae bacterium]|jgi:PAS domain S-box-containing protein|nr:PAS domain S-box protein [Solirubrobacteraceae bacterium]
MSLIEALLDSAPDAVVLVDGSGRLALVNRRTEEMFGYGSGALFGSYVELLVPERYRSAHLIRRDLYAEQPRRRVVGRGVDLLGLREDGSEFPVEIGLSPIAVEAEDFVIAVIRDVSEQRAAELERAELAGERAARARAEAECGRLASMLGGLDAIVWEADAERHRFSFVSARAEELLGYPLSSWLHEEGFWQRIVEPEDLALAELQFREAVGCTSDHEYRVRDANGRVVWLRDRVRVARAHGGGPRLHGVTMDVTRRRAADGRVPLAYLVPRRS